MKKVACRLIFAMIVFLLSFIGCEMDEDVGGEIVRDCRWVRKHDGVEVGWRKEKSTRYREKNELKYRTIIESYIKNDAGECKRAGWTIEDECGNILDMYEKGTLVDCEYEYRLEILDGFAMMINSTTGDRGQIEWPGNVIGPVGLARLMNNKRSEESYTYKAFEFYLDEVETVMVKNKGFEKVKLNNDGEHELWHVEASGYSDDVTHEWLDVNGEWKKAVSNTDGMVIELISEN